MNFIGIDLGTSATKRLLVDETGTILSTVTKEYPLEFPKARLEPAESADWWKAVTEGIPELLNGFDASWLRASAVVQDAWSCGAG